MACAVVIERRAAPHDFQRASGYVYRYYRTRFKFVVFVIYNRAKYKRSRIARVCTLIQTYRYVEHVAVFKLQSVAHPKLYSGKLYRFAAHKPFQRRFGYMARTVVVIYYRITEGNHNVKYGQWIVRIRKNTEYIIVNFQKAFTMEYGETVFGTDLITQLIDDNGNSEYIELGEGVEGMTLLQLRRIARAYAYEDVTSNMGFVGGNTPAGKYSIRFMFREEYADGFPSVIR